MSQYAALIKTSSGKAVEERSLPGLFDLLLQHKVEETSANFRWSGPKIDNQEWARMMAYFEWTYAEYKSEAQVRWYVHPRHGWKCWAYEQEGATGMTTCEHPLDTSPNKEQRLQFNESDGWWYFMTVHHHCSAGAFQSGTDKADEEKVDGLHITIGNLDKSKRSLDARMYLQGHRFEPCLSHFWDIGEDTKAQVEVMKAKLGEVEAFASIQFTGVIFDEDKLALQQMAQAAPAETVFPEIWKTNYVVRKVVTTQESAASFYLGLHQGNKKKAWCSFCGGWRDHTSLDCEKNPNRRPDNHQPPTSDGQPLSRKQQMRQEKLVGKGGGGKGVEKQLPEVSVATIYQDIVMQLAILGYQGDDLDTLMQWALDNRETDAYLIIFNEMQDAGITPAQLWEHHEAVREAELRRELEAEARETAQELPGEGKGSAVSGGPDNHWSGWDH